MMSVSVPPQQSQRGIDPLAALRTVRGEEHGTYMEAARALNLLADEEEPILAMEEAMAHGDTPQTLVTLLGTLVIAEFQVFPIICECDERFRTLRKAMTADVDDTAIGDEDDRAELVLERLEEELKLNDKTMADYGLPIPVSTHGMAEVQQEATYWERRAGKLRERLDKVSTSTRCTMHVCLCQHYVVGIIYLRVIVVCIARHVQTNTALALAPKYTWTNGNKQSETLYWRKHDYHATRVR